MILFNRAPYCGTEERYIAEAIRGGKICGDGPFTKQCNAWLEERFSAQKVLLTTSGTTALDMAFLLCGLRPGDEVILPSFTFSSTATAAVLAGAKLVFVDVRPDTMNIDETLIEAAVTERTRAVVPVHYAGVACEMDTIMDIAKRHNLFVVEDAAQGINATYKGKHLGAIGDFGCYSFHETKNLSMGEGGALLIQDAKYIEDAEIIREKGTNRSQFFRGQIDKYRWVNYGSSYLPSDMNAAYLWAQLECIDAITAKRLALWRQYDELLQPLQESGLLALPHVPEGCVHNGHMYYVRVKDLEERTRLIEFLKGNGIWAVFHYVPLHSAPAGLKFGRFSGEDVYTTRESERLLRLPMFYSLTPAEVDYIVGKVKEFYHV